MAFRNDDDFPEDPEAIAEAEKYFPCTVCGAPDHDAGEHGLPREWSKQEQEDFEKVSNLYSSLSQEEIRTIVAWWDEENGLMNWRDRLKEKDNRPQRIRRLRFLATVLTLLFVVGGGWLYVDYSQAKNDQKKLKYIYYLSPYNNQLQQGLKWADGVIKDNGELHPYG